MTSFRVAYQGSYRPAHRVREGWQVYVLGSPETGEPSGWLTVTEAERVYSPVSFVRLGFNDESHDTLWPNDEVRCRTLAEVKAAGL